VAAAEQVALEHPLHRVLAEHLDDAAVGRELRTVGVLGKCSASQSFFVTS